MHKTYRKPVITVTTFEAEDIIATSGIIQQAAPASTITKADGTTIGNMTSVAPQNFNSIFN